MENKEQALEFLSKLIERINTQDNHGTALPYFYIVKTKKWRVAHPEFYGSDTKQVFTDVQSGDYQQFDSKEEAIKHLVEHCDIEASEAEEVFERDFEEFTMERYEEEDNVFLTEEGYKEHVRLNGHNLSRKGEYNFYIKHAWRNPEMADLLKAVALVCGKELRT